MPGCCVPGCGSREKAHMSFHTLPRNGKLRKLWLENSRNPKLSDKIYTTLHHMEVCRVHFRDIQYRTANKQKLNTLAYPVLFLPVIKDVDVREFVRGAVPPIFNNDTITNSKESSAFDDNYFSIISSMPVESNENDLEAKSDKIVAEPEVRPAPILFVSTSADYEEEEEVLTTSNKELHTDCDPLKKRIVQNPRHLEQCKVESPMKTERNWNLVLYKNSALQKKVNVLQNRNRRLERRVKSLKTLLRYSKKTHA